MWSRRGHRGAAVPPEGSGQWVRCTVCGEIVSASDVAERHEVCPACGVHHAMAAAARLSWLADPGSVQEIGAAASPADPLRFEAGGKYRASLREAARRSGSDEAVRAAEVRIEGRAVVAMVSEPEFASGSLGGVAATRLRLAMERAGAGRLPAVLFAAGGGQRLAEGLTAMASLPEVADARAALYADGVPFLSVIAPPRPSGALLALALSADVVFTEPLTSQVGWAASPGGPVAAGLADRETPRARLRQELREVLDRLEPIG